MDRRDQYKPTFHSVEDIKIKQRTLIIELHKQKRYQVFHSKRIKLDTDRYEEEEIITKEEVKEATSQLVKKSADKKKILITLCRAFAQDVNFMETFLGVENSMSSLVGILSGQDSDDQLYAAWCLTNMAIDTHEHTVKVLSAAGPYFITYLQSGNVPLQDQCCWALGNIAGDCQKCRKTLAAQGAIPPLVRLLDSAVADACQSAAFALSNLAQGGESICSHLLKHNIFSTSSSHLSVAACSKRISVTVEVAWMYFYTISGLGCNPLVQESCIDETILNFLVSLHSEPFIYVPELVTPLIRCVGNFACNEKHREKLKKSDGIVDILIELLNSSYSHLTKETLWVISNLAVDEDIVHLMQEKNLLPSLLSHTLSLPNTLQELLSCLCNISSHHGPAKEWMTKQGLLHAALPFLRSADDDCVKLCVQLLGLLLYNPTSKTLLVDNTVISSLETLQFHQNTDIQNLVCSLLNVSTKVPMMDMDV